MADKYDTSVGIQDRKHLRTDERITTNKKVKDYLWPPERRSVKELIEYYQQEIKRIGKL